MKVKIKETGEIRELNYLIQRGETDPHRIGQASMCMTMKTSAHCGMTKTTQKPKWIKKLMSGGQIYLNAWSIVMR